MKKILGFGLFVAVLAVFVDVTDGFAAKKQSAINMGTKVRARIEATGVYDEECYEAYYGCMDQFCIVDNEMGGSCNCSDEVKKYESALSDIKQMLAEAERIRTEEVEKVEAGANADIIFKGSREYDDKGNVIATKATKDKTEIQKSMWSTSSLYDTYDEDDEDDGDVFGKTGNELYSAAHDICKTQIDSSCDKDMKILTQIYLRQIASDCKGLANSIDQKKSEAKTALNEANRAVRSALRKSLEESNKYDRGTCMVEYRNCMKGEDACGSDWGQCVFTIASENMQNNTAKKSVAGKKVKTVTVYDITPSTMEILESKRFICEKVLDSCVAVRDLVWNDFLREVAPTLRLAEFNIESKKRQSCLADISDCIQKACKDNIAGKDVESMDACLSRPDMARSFCKIQIEPCERMESKIWDYVKAKLAALRVDACTQEVKDCFTDKTRCGEDFSNCIGMDYNYIHNICPIDKLVVCKQANPNFKMSDLDDMLMGLYLNIDNAELENCQNLVNEKMLEICGSTSDCNSLATDEYIGTGSLRSVKDGNIYRITGTISFGAVDVGMDLNNSGIVDIENYMAKAREYATGVKDADAILNTIEQELKNVQGTINRVVKMIGSDPKIDYCVNGRSLEQITGKLGEFTTGRYPYLLNQVKQRIAIATLRQAQANYQIKYNELLTKATKGADIDIAQYMCQMLPVSGGAQAGVVSDEDFLLAPPYSISYEVGAGLNKALLAQGGRGSSQTTKDVNVDSEFKTNQASKVYNGKGRWSPASIIAAAGDTINQGISVTASMGDGKFRYNIPGGTRESWAMFNRETRNCHFCTSTVSKNCSSEYKKGLWGIGAKQAVNCTESAPVEKCEDIEM